MRLQNNFTVNHSYILFIINCHVGNLVLSNLGGFIVIMMAYRELLHLV